MWLEADPVTAKFSKMTVLSKLRGSQASIEHIAQVDIFFAKS